MGGNDRYSCPLSCASGAGIVRALRAFVLRLAALLYRGNSDAEFAEELRTNLQMQVDDHVRAGMTLQEARRQALLKLGGLELTKEVYRERRSLPFLETLI